MQEVTDPKILAMLNSNTTQQPKQKPMQEVTDPELLEALNADSGRTMSFLKGFTKNVDEYSASINKGLDYVADTVTGRDTKFFEDNKDYWNKQSKLNSLETSNHPYYNFAGQMILDPANVTPAGIVSKGQKIGKAGSLIEKLAVGATKTKPRAIATSMGLGAGIGTATTAIKDYGNDSLTTDEKINNMEWGAGIVAGVNGLISALTKGRVNNVIKPEMIQGAKSDEDIANAILNNADAMGLSPQETQAISGEILQGKYPKVPNEFKIEQAGFRKQYEPNFQMKPNHPPVTMDMNKALSVLAREADKKRVAQGLEPIYQHKYEVQPQYAKESIYPQQPEQPYNPNFVSGDFNNNIPVPYNANAELMQRYQQVASHPRLQELLSMRENISAKDAKSPQRVVSKGGYRELNGNGGENKHAYDKALYEKNYATDFHLTKQDIGQLYRGQYDDNLLSKLETDLSTLDNHPDYAKSFNSENNIDYKAELAKLDDTDIKMNSDDWKEANELFSKGIDNLVVGTYAGIGEDENGNMTFDPEKFILGLGGYTAVKHALKNGTIRGKLKEYATDAINKVNFNPEIQKEGNSFNSMFVGTNSKNYAKSYAKKSVVDLGGHDITKANYGDKNGQLEIFEKSPYAQGRNSINHIEVPDNLRRSGKGTELLNKAKNEYDNISAQASNENSVKFFYKNGFRPTFNKDLSVEDAIKAFKENGSSLNMEWRKGIEKGAFSDVATKKTMKEIDDSKAKVSNGTWGTSEDIKAGNSTTAKLDEILDHKELFEKYPELKNTIVHLKPDMQGASFDADANRIIVGYDTKTKNINKSSLLHEIQHSIQAKEGWARGGSPDNIHPKDMYETIIERYGNLPVIERIEKDYLNGKIPTENKMYEKIINIASGNYGGIEALKYDTYKRLHGEQQARATQYRKDMTPQERQKESWQGTLKRVEGEYKEPIIKYDGDVSEMSVSSKEKYSKKIDVLKKHLEGKELNPEQQKIANVYLGKRNMAELKTDDISTIQNTLHLTKGNVKVGAKHIIFKHFGEKRDSLTPDELIDIVDIIRKADVENITPTRREYTYYDADNTRLKVIVDEHKKNGNDFIVSFYTNRKKPTVGHNDTYFKKEASNADFDKAIIPQKEEKQKGLLARVAEQKRLEGLPEKGRKVYHPLREREYYLGDSGTVYFKRGNGTYREMPNEEIRNDIHTIAKIGTNKFKAQRLEQDAEFNKSFKQTEITQKEDSYKMEHTAPTADEVNSRADDVTNSFSDDIYSKDAQRLHGHGSPKMDKESIEVINKVKNNPDAEVTIYRAIPKDVDAGINSKDWVTISKEYAKTHGENVLNGNYKIVEKKVKAKDLWTDGNSIHEWGYDPHTKPTKLMANGMHSMAGGFAGGTDSLINQRDYNGDGKYDYKDLLAGVVAGTISINALKKAAPKLFEEEEGGFKAGLFAGSKAKGFKEAEKAGKKFEGKYDTLERFEIDDSKANIKATAKELNSIKRERLNKQADDIREQYESGAFSEKEALELLDKNFLELPKGNNGAFNLSDVLDHKELYDNYPTLFDAKLTFTDMPKGANGYYDAKANEIVLNSAMNKEDIKSSLLHEIQHAIQNKEGFARGGSAQEFYNDAKSKIDLLKYELEFEPDDFIRDKKLKQLSEIETAYKNGGKEEAFKKYQRLSGEIEARDVQARMNYTPEQREKIAPYSSENIAPEDAINKFRPDDSLANGMMNSEEKPFKEKVKEAKKKELKGNMVDRAINKGVKAVAKGIDDLSDNKISGVYKDLKEKEIVDNIIGHKIYEKKDYMKWRDDALRERSSRGLELESLHKQLSELPQDTRVGLYDYMTGNKNVNISDGVKKLGDKYIKDIDDRGKQLVDDGILSQEAFNRWKGAYLKRRYASKMGSAKNAFYAVKGKTVNPIIARGKHWKGTQSEYEKLLKNNEIGNFTDGKIEAKELPNGKFEFSRDWTPEERKNMGEIKDAAFSIPDTLSHLDEMVAHAKLLKRVAGKYVLSPKEIENYTPKQIENAGYIKLSGEKYGALDGQYVERSVANDIQELDTQINGTDSSVKEAISEYMKWYKSIHTIYNPKTHFNNIMSNLVGFAFMEGRGLKTLKTVAPEVGKGFFPKAVTTKAKSEALIALNAKKMVGTATEEELEKLAKLEVDNDVKLWTEAKKDGLFGGNKLNDTLNSYMKPTIKKVDGLGSKIQKKAEDVYSFEDDIVRFALYKQFKEEGHDSINAIREIGKIIPDYSKPMSKVANWLRRYGVAPFIAFPYYSTPIMMRQIAERPTRPMTLAAMIYGLYQAQGMNMFDEKDAPERFRKSYAPFMKSGDNVYGVKYDRWLPHLDLMKIYKMPIDTLWGGNPYISLGGAITGLADDNGGYSPYFGGKITHRKGVKGKLDILGSLASGFITPDIVDSGISLISSLARSEKARRSHKVYNPKNTPQNILNTLGLNTASFRKSEQRKKIRREKLK